MNKLIALALLALTLSACDASAPTQSTAAATHAAASAAPVEKPGIATPFAGTVHALPASANEDPQTDRAIDNVLGNHAAYHKAMTDFQKAVAANDRAGVAAMVRYPMRVDLDGKQVVIEDAARFKQYYSKLITPKTAKVIADSQYSSLMINNQGVMLGGQAWITGVCADTACKNVDVKIATIQPKSTPAH